MAAEDDDRPNAVLVYQVAQLEKQLGIGIRDLHGRLDRIENEMRSLTFVSEKGYQADRAADERVRAAKAEVLEEYARDTRVIAENARATAWAVAGLLLVSIGTLLAIIKAVAG